MGMGENGGVKFRKMEGKKRKGKKGKRKGD